MSENRVIGRNGRIPWSLPDDLLRFKKLTRYSTLIMGRLTFESIGEPLSGRHSYVITSRHINVKNEHVKLFRSIRSAHADSSINAVDTWIIGGQEIYKQALEELHIEEIYMTVVHETIEGDAYFPLLPEDTFEIDASTIEEKEENNIRYSFVKLVRRKESV